MKNNELFLNNKETQKVTNNNEALLDFVLTSGTHISLLDKNGNTVCNLPSSVGVVLGDILMSNMAKNIIGDVGYFSKIKITGADGETILPINSSLLKNWAFNTAHESNKAPVIKKQFGIEGDTVTYIRHNGSLKMEGGSIENPSNSKNKIKGG